MKKIIVGVDGSMASMAAAVKARELAAAMNAEIELIHSIPRVVESMGDPLVLGDDWSARRTENAHRILFDTEDRLRINGEEIRTSLLEGDPAACIALEAERADVWMVVVGHRDRGAARRTLLGSTADRLLQICPKPVLVVR